MKNRFLGRFIILLFYSIILFSATSYLFAQTVVSESFVDWTEKTFDSKLSLDMKDANLSFPTGKSTAVNRINNQLPALIKDSLLALNVDSSFKLEDLVVNGMFSFDNVIGVIDNGPKTPGIFDRKSTSISIEHSMELQDISNTMVKHHKPYTPQAPIEQVSSRIYSGIIIDARGILSVHGEFVSQAGEPCFFPKIWDENMDLLYEKNMIEPEIAKKQGAVVYGYSDKVQDYKDRIGSDPLWIKARKIYGSNRTDPIISKKDALKILSVSQNISLLKQGKVVILLDKEQLIHAAQPRAKEIPYYVILRDLKDFFYKDKVPDVIVGPTETGLKISIQNLRFVADSWELLPEEKLRLDTVAEMLRQVSQEGEFTVTVEGHTASVGKPNGELTLSIQRAQAIIKAMADRNIDTGNFTYKGYGGTMPVGDNATEEGRAKNRRVEITVIPKATYIQRDWATRGAASY